MAYYNDTEDEQVDPNAAAAAPQQPGQQSGSVISGQGASTGTSPTPAAAAPNTGSAKSNPGSPFADIKTYLDANKSQSAKLATDTAGIVDKASQQVRDTLPQQTDLYNQSVQQNTVNLDKNLFNEAKKTAETVAADKAKADNFARMRDAQYKGPTSLETSEFYKPVEQSYNKAITAGENTKTDDGQGSLLRDLQQQTRGRINESAINLDKALLKGEEARDILGKSVTNQSDLAGSIKNAQDQSVVKASEAKATTDATRNAVQTAFTGPNSVQKNLEKAIEARVAPLVSQGKKEAETIKSLLATNTRPTNAQLKQLGITGYDWNDLQALATEQKKVAAYGEAEYTRLKNIVEDQRARYDKYVAEQKAKGSKENFPAFNAVEIENEVSKLRNLPPIEMDLSKYAKSVNSGITGQNVATAQEYARYAALNELMNTKNGYLTDPSKAGTYSTDSINFNLGSKDGGGAFGDLQQLVNAAKARQTSAIDADNAAGRAARELERQNAKAIEDNQGGLLGAGIGGVFGGTQGAAIGAAGGKAAVQAGRKWCFIIDTPILMADGSFKQVQDLELGDVTAIGGKVTFHGVTLTDRIVEYKGRYTSPSHTVFNGEQWVRAEDLVEGTSLDAVELDMPEGIEVFPVSTEFHRLVSDNDVLYADYEEMDSSSDMSDKEIIEQMNKSVALGADKLCHEHLKNKSGVQLFELAVEGLN